MVLIPVRCPYCHSAQVIKGGKTETGKQRYRCQNPDCPHHSFLLDPAYKGRLPEIKQQVIDMSLNGSGIRDTARVLKISPTTVINELKKKGRHSPLSTTLLLTTCHPATWKSLIRRADEAEVDEMWSFVGKKKARDGCGMPSITAAGRSWPMSLVGAKTRSF